MLGHADVLVFFEPGALYHVPAARFWDLYERHRDAAEADEIAWVAATQPVYTDECFTDCDQGPRARAWRRLVVIRQVMAGGGASPK